MNNKFLISLLFSLLSGCATTQTAQILTSGTGGGAVDLKTQLNHKTASSKPISIATADSNSKKEPFALTLPQLDNSDYQSIDNHTPLKNQTEAAAKQDSQTTNSVVNNLLLKKHTTQSTQKEKSLKSETTTSSAGNPSRYVISGENYKVLPFRNGFVERGIASWYGPDFQGEKTSNGEVYDMNAMTAAHKSLPIPSYVKVTNLKNKRSVVLRINDRGPFYADRVIDLSYAAAQKLDIHQPGTEMVEIEAIKTSGKESVYLQLGVFSNPENAQILQRKVVENKMPEPMVKQVRLAGKLAYRVQLGPIFSLAKVNEFNAKLSKMGISETWYVTENQI
jgi:rare lipoprotein A